MAESSQLNELFSNLATLASLEYQERYVFGGTKEEYVVVDDLIDDYLTSVDWMNTQIMSSLDQQVLNDFAKYLMENRGEALAVSNFAAVRPLTKHSKIWLNIRQHALEALGQLGLKLDSVTVEELDEHIWEYDVQSRMGVED